MHTFCVKHCGNCDKPNYLEAVGRWLADGDQGDGRPPSRRLVVRLDRDDGAELWHSGRRCFNMVDGSCLDDAAAFYHVESSASSASAHLVN